MAYSNSRGDVVLDVRDLRTHFITRWGEVKAVNGVTSSFDAVRHWE